MWTRDDDLMKKVRKILLLVDNCTAHSNKSLVMVVDIPKDSNKFKFFYLRIWLVPNPPTPIDGPECHQMPERPLQKENGA